MDLLAPADDDLVSEVIGPERQLVPGLTLGKERLNSVELVRHRWTLWDFQGMNEVKVCVNLEVPS